MKEKKGIYFTGLNPLRFISAFAIIIAHVTLGLQSTMQQSALKQFLHNLNIGVDMFFLVSGFLITFMLIDEKSETGSLSIRGFYMRRVLRILPLYYLIIAIAFFEYHVSNPEINFNRFICFTGNFWLIKINTWTVGVLNPLWSLCIEEQFYLVIPFLILCIPTKYLKYLFWIIILVSVLFRFWVTKTVEYSWMTIYCHTLSRCDVLAIGGLLAYYHRTANFKITMNKYFLLGVLAYLILLMAVVDFGNYTGVLNATLKKMLFVIPMLLLFMGLVLNKDEGGRVINWIKTNRVIDYLGKISFGLYMYHTFVGEHVQELLKTDSVLLHAIVTISLTILISAISFEFFEKRIIGLKRFIPLN